MARVVVVNNIDTFREQSRREWFEQWHRAGHEIFVISPAAPESVVAASWPVEWIDWRLVQHGMNPLSELAATLFLIKQFRRIRPDVILNIRMKPALYGSIAARVAGCPSVNTLFTGLGHYFVEPEYLRSPAGRVISSVLRWAMGHNEHVIFQNADDEAHFLQHGFARAGSTAVIPGSGVNTDCFRPDHQPPQPASFILSTRLMTHKGVLEYCRAAAIVRRSHPAAVFRIAGGYSTEPSGVQPEELARWIDDGTIEYLGEVRDVRPYIARAAVAVLPSYYREGVPRSLLEALAMGKPIITTDMPGCRDTVIPGVNGWLVPPRNAEALADICIRFIEKPELVAAMGNASRDIAVSRFDVAKVATALSAILCLSEDQVPVRST